MSFVDNGVGSKQKIHHYIRHCWEPIQKLITPWLEQQGICCMGGTDDFFYYFFLFISFAYLYKDKTYQTHWRWNLKFLILDMENWILNDWIHSMRYTKIFQIEKRKTSKKEKRNDF